MIDIHVGEYVRTTQGYIAKVERIDDTFIWFDGVIWFDYEECWELRIKSELGLDDQLNEIIKHSFNIIDLIESGDYVNGSEVYDVKKIASKNYEQSWILLSNYDRDAILSKQIKNVVTKEQFKSMEYKVGGEDD